MSESTPSARGLHLVGADAPKPETEQPAVVTHDVLQQVIAQTVREIEAKADRPNPFALRTFDDIERFAVRIAASGLCPKGYEKKPDDIVIALLYGQELGLPPMTALKSIAVINQRPTVWGEAVPALCMRTGQVEDVQESWEGQPMTPEFTAVCVVKRKGLSARRGEFSLSDAARAKLGSVHTSYPKDMIMWRARHRAWHGAFPDVLSGIGTREIEEDDATRGSWVMPMPEMAWQTPKPSEAGWDAAWFNATHKALGEEQNGFAWLELLIQALADAPKLRDVMELEQSPNVMATLAGAPTDVKASIGSAFGEARTRLTEADKPPPAKPKAAAKPKPAAQPDPKPEPVRQPDPEPPQQAVSEFDYYLFSCIGEIAGEDSITDPVAWAQQFVALRERTFPADLTGLLEHNADALEDARKDAKAAAILADAPPAEVEIKVVEAPAEGAPKSAWTGYVKAFSAAIGDVQAPQFMDWVATQAPHMQLAPQASRMALVKAMAGRAKELGVDPPTGIFPAPAATQEPPRTETVAGEPAKQEAAQEPPERDKDRALLDNMLTDIARCTSKHELQLLTNGQAMMVPLKRWTASRPELASELQNKVAALLVELP